jgi:hypothetical protein
VPALHQVAGDAPEHAAHLVLALCIVEQVDRGDQLKGAQLEEGHGITHLIRDAEWLRLLVRVRQTNHLGGDIDTEHRRGALLL